MLKKKKMINNRIALKKIFSTLKVFGQQGLPSCSHENDSNLNFLCFLIMRAEDVTELDSWRQRNGHKWLLHDLQDEILDLMSSSILTDS